MAYGKRRRDRHARSQGKTRGKRASSTAAHGTFGNPHSRTLRLEQLEDRRLLAAFRVTNLFDLQPDGDGGLEVVPGSLRDAIVQANEFNDFDTIAFEEDAFQFGTSLFLQNDVDDNFGQLLIEQPVQIVGPGPGKLVIHASPGDRIFETNIEGDDEIFSVEISGVTLTSGIAQGSDDDGKGGAIFNREALTMTEVAIFNNSASNGGGAIFTDFGSLTLDRSLISGNTSGTHGGGILSGSEMSDPAPRTYVTNSTITGNSADIFAGYGGGIFNLIGRTLIQHSTITGNSAYLGSGVGSQGNPLPDMEGDPPPPPVVSTNILSSILFGNSNFLYGMPLLIDADTVGTEGEGEDEVPLAASINIGPDPFGFNIIFGPGVNGMTPMLGATDRPSGTDPMFISDFFGEPILAEWGGSTPTFHPDAGSPAIDNGPALAGFNFEQRGRHFTRLDGVSVDIGAIEVQSGSFFVDSLEDETDNQFSAVADVVFDPFFGTTTITVHGYEAAGDFTLREALEFSQGRPSGTPGFFEIGVFGVGVFGNPAVDTIRFSSSLALEDDPTFSPAPTILLTMGPLDVVDPGNFLGPVGFVLEIDANDPTPGLKNSDGGRVFNIDDGNSGNLIDVSIENLTLVGADTVGSGGAIFSRENLTLTGSTIMDSGSSLDGGAVFIQFGNLTINRSTLAGNIAADDGGGLYIDPLAGVVTITNSTISGNQAGDRGAGIFNRGGNTEVSYSTITLNNSASTRASGINNASGGVIEVRSSIVSGNVNNDIEAFSGGVGNINSGGYNLIGNGNASYGFIGPGDLVGPSYDPQLAPLVFGGGLTPTHALLGGSDAINAGNPAPPTAPMFDQRGEPFERVDPDSLMIDIGAYELQGITFTVDNAGDANDGNFGMDELTLREAISLANLSPLKDFIDFSPMLFGATITVGNSLVVTDSVDIFGLGTTLLTIAAGGTTSFVIDDGLGTDSEVGISLLTMQGGSGGLISSFEALTITELVLTGNTAGAISQLRGSLTIIDSTITGNSKSGTGGALSAVSATVDITYSTISGNSTNVPGGHGGGIFLSSATLTGNMAYITNNLVPDSSADGGGIFADAGSNVALTDSIVSGNISTGSNSEGAGIFSRDGVVTLNDSIVALNKTFGTDSQGAGIYLDNSTLTLNNTLVTQNTTSGEYSSGGGIASHDGIILLNQSTVANNQTTGANASGGGIFNVDGTLTLRESTVSGNSTSSPTSHGGGIYSHTFLVGSGTNIINSTISGNTTNGIGGGIYNAEGLTTISHSTITDNVAPYIGSGAGVGSFGDSATTLTQVQSSIIAGNTTDPTLAADFDSDGDADGADFLAWQRGFGRPNALLVDGDADGDTDVDGNDLGTWELEFGNGKLPSDVDRVSGVFDDTFQSLGFNLIGTGLSTGAFNNLGDQTGVTDPMLGLLALNGGPTLTHDVLLGSPAINLGDPGFDPVSFSPPLVNDQRGAGFARVVGGQIDIGAVESVFVPPLAADFDIDGDVDGADFLAWQRGLGTLAAVKSDGDADNDADVDNVDLSLWEATFGNGVAAVAASTSGPLDVSSAPLAAESLATATTSVIISAAVTPDVGDRLQRGSFGVLTSLTMASQIEIDTASYVDDSALVLDAGNITARDASLATFTPTAAGDDFGDIAAERELADDDQAYAPEDDVFASLGAFGL